MPALRTIVLGMRGAFTAEALRALLAANCGVSGLVVPGIKGTPWRRLQPQKSLAPVSIWRDEDPRQPWRAADPPSAVELAWDAGIPVVEVGWVDAAGLRALDALEPDVAAIACFPWLLPRPWRDRPPRGCVNLHPSLLPAYRGPAPLFWQFRAGESRTGVSLHAVDGGADTGSLIAQQAVPFPDGIDTARAETLTAQAGARLLADWLLDGKTVGPLASQAVAAFRNPAPTDAARVVSATWP